MKSVFKAIAPIAMTITVALSGVAMAETASSAAKSADTGVEKITANEATKPVVHHKKHVVKEEAKTEAAAPTATVPAAEKSAAATAPATPEKPAPTVAASTKPEPKKAQ